MTDLDTLVAGNSRQIDSLVPFEQEIFVAGELGELFGAQ
jgi:hypothetical protein